MTGVPSQTRAPASSLLPLVLIVLSLPIAPVSLRALNHIMGAAGRNRSYMPSIENRAARNHSIRSDWVAPPGGSRVGVHRRFDARHADSPLGNQPPAESPALKKYIADLRAWAEAHFFSVALLIYWRLPHR